MLVALHARKSAAAVRAFHERHPDRPLIVALTGTDLYGDLPRRNRSALASVELADRVIVLQESGRRAVPAGARRKVRVIHQSVVPPSSLPLPAADRFDVVVLAHLRAVKDPLRAALAVRSLPDDSRVHVTHLGRVLEERLGVRARAETARNPRYEWLGERPRATTLRLLARSRLLVVASRMEGGANVVGEAAVLGVPVLASNIAGNTGLLGARHPGLFDVLDTRGLRELLLRAESDAAFYARLQAASRRIAPLFAPSAERLAWRRLLDELRTGRGRAARR